MPGIDPSIVKHEINTYLDASPVQKRLRDVNPRKALIIKEEVENLLNVGFIYPVLLTKCMSNPVPVNKNKELSAYVWIFETQTRLVLRTNSQLLSSIKFFMRA
jgi:hypothetical protein